MKKSKKVKEPRIKIKYHLENINDELGELNSSLYRINDTIKHIQHQNKTIFDLIDKAYNTFVDKIIPLRIKDLE